MENKLEKNTLYLECYSGISGDMTVAALIDLGADKEVLLSGLNSLSVEGYHVVIGRRIKSSIDACDFDVILDKTTNSPLSEHMHIHKHHTEPIHKQPEIEYHSATSDTLEKHTHEHHNHEHHNDHTHMDHKQHHHNEDHSHGHLHLGHHEHRNLNDINLIIEHSSITDNAKVIAKKIFHIVAVAESTAHGKSIDEIHFHEVGAIDSIVDIVAAAICLDNLNIGEVIVSQLYEGTGHIKCQHGTLPVPVPAVINIVIAHQLSLHITAIKGEMVTPTGAAIVAAIKTKDTLPKSFNILKLGLGAGKREYEQAGILRAMLIKDNS